MSLAPTSRIEALYVKLPKLLDQDLTAVFEFVHELLLEEGEETTYSVSAPSVYGYAEVDARADVAGQGFSAVDVENINVPALKGGAVGYSLGSLQLRSQDVDWLQAQVERWERVLTVSTGRTSSSPSATRSRISRGIRCRRPRVSHARRSRSSPARVARPPAR